MRTLSISRRGQLVIESPNRKFLPLLQETEKKGVRVYKLNTGDPDIETPSLFFQTVRQFNKKNLGYAPSSGDPVHIEAWIRYYRQWGITVGKEHIIPTSGCAEAILFALLAVADAGDEIIVFEPLYASYNSFATMIGVTLIPVTLMLHEDFAMPAAAQIEKKITARTKAIIVINPDNPTGKLWTEKEIGCVIRIARKYGLFLIADETYREICFIGKPSCILARPSVREHAILVDSVSKRYSLPGARIGCIVSYNPLIMRTILKFAQARLSVGTLEQYALVPLLNKSKSITAPLRREYRKRRDVVIAKLSRIPGVTCTKPEGAFYVMAQLPIDSAEEFVKFLIRDFSFNGETVMISPMQDFYISPRCGEREIRIAYVLNTRALTRAMDLLARGLEAYQKRRA